jgi:hypothetical protein
MRLLCFKRLVRVSFGAFLVLLMQGALAPSAVWAGCNHLVGSDATAPSVIAHLDELITGGPIQSIDGHPADGLPGRRSPKVPLPCSGPSCSNRLPAPPAPVVSSIDGLDHWGLLCDSLDLTASITRNDRVGETLLHLVIAPSRIFHPPRSLA